MLLQEKFRNSIKPEKVLLLLQKILFFVLGIPLFTPCMRERTKKTCLHYFVYEKKSTRRTLHLILAKVLIEETILALIIQIIHVKKKITTIYI